MRTIITSIAAIATTGLTVWFALRTLERRERISLLEKELRNVFQEFSLLYKAESKYVSDLAKATSKAEQQIKIEVRKEATSGTDDKITLTPDSIIKRRKELGIQ